MPEASPATSPAGLRTARPIVRHADLLAYRAEFPLLAAATYLNTCSLGALSTRSRVSLDRFMAQWDAIGARAWYRHWLDELAALRADFGAVIGRQGSEIALAPNVSTALDYSLFNNKRYFRYRVTLVSNQAQTLSPQVNDVVVNWSR